MARHRLNDLHAALATGRRRAMRTESLLASAYEQALRSNGLRSASLFSERVQALTAAAAPGWQMPTPDEVFDLLAGQERLRAATGSSQATFLKEAMGPVLASAGVKFDLKNPLVQHVLGQLGGKITMVAETQRESIMGVIDSAWQQGLSIRDTAKMIEKSTIIESAWRGSMIARTEMIGAVNAGGLAAVRITEAASAKVWLSASQGNTRPSHEEADGQTLPLSEPFEVGDGYLQHPGDPDGPPEEVVNCRCTMIYDDSME